MRVLSRTTAKLFRCVCVMFSRATAKFIGVCIFFFSGCWMPRLSLCVCVCYLSGCYKAHRCVGVLLTGLLHSVSSGLSQSSLSHVRAPPGLLVTKLLDGYACFLSGCYKVSHCMIRSGAKFSLAPYINPNPLIKKKYIKTTNLILIASYPYLIASNF